MQGKVPYIRGKMQGRKRNSGQVSLPPLWGDGGGWGSRPKPTAMTAAALKLCPLNYAPSECGQKQLLIDINFQNLGTRIHRIPFLCRNQGDNSGNLRKNRSLHLHRLHDCDPVTL